MTHPIFNGKHATTYGTIYYHNSNGQYHCEDGPAITFKNGEKQWWINGKLHRLDGPAIELPWGKCSWWFNHKFIPVESQKEFEQYLKLIVFI
jgi:hypothetical protein